MNRVIIFLTLSIPVILISWRSLSDFRNHGFYRFFSWECILWLFATNSKFWFINPLSINQIFSWILLLISIYFVIAGVTVMKKKGKPSKSRNEDGLFQFEQTTELINTGVFRYIRHPLYSSLLFLTWGIYLKHPTFELLMISFLSTFFVYLTAIMDEKECISFFGEKYLHYMKSTRRFIPYLL
jgi:protein-S-isoprenylcysteine O-methyltransferase Ste14